MALLTKAPRGTADILPGESEKRRYVTQAQTMIAESFGFSEISTPVFEHTELFNRSVGETTDVVQKEMYTFEDNGKRSVTLRPEGTAGAVRAFLEHGLFNEPMPQKLFYHTSCYRYEKPQAGRLREFHQFGVECLGAASPAADAEVIALGKQVFDFFELENIKLEINSIGCPVCRKDYHNALLKYFEGHSGELCETCLSRLEKNPMRILDCKSPICSAIAKDAPKTIDYLCDDCKNHFDLVKSYLQSMKIDYTVNPMIVRGLDYYTRTVFEFVSENIGAQGTVCGGGRYDGLIGELGGAPLPACGFGMGLERLMLLLTNSGYEFPEERKPYIYIAPAEAKYQHICMQLANELRSFGVYTLTDIEDRSIKAQMKYANKLGAKFTTVIGEDEYSSGILKVKDMANGETEGIEISGFVEEIAAKANEETLKDTLGEDFLSFLGDLGEDMFDDAEFEEYPDDDDDNTPSNITLFRGGKK